MDIFKNALGLAPPQNAATFRSQLDSLADEYERLQSETHRISKENAEMREQLEQVGHSQSPTSNSIGHLSGEEAWAKEANCELPSEHVSSLAPRSYCRREYSFNSPAGSQPLFGSKSSGLHDAPTYQEYANAVTTSEEDARTMQDLDMQSRLKDLMGVASTGPTKDNGIAHLDMDVIENNSENQKSSESDSHNLKEGILDGISRSELLKPQKRASGLGVLSKWFNPRTDDSQGVASETSMDSDPFFKYQLKHETDTTQQDFATIRPLGGFRLAWDFFAFLLLLIELWATPFELVFMQELDTPMVLKVLSHCITSFFFVDIALNFSTGYIEGDVTVMKRRAIIKTYLKFWFWVDLVSTLPFDLLAETVAGNMFSIARVGKISKALKVLRYLKMVRAIRLIKTMKQAGHLRRHFQILGPVRAVMQPVQVLIFLMLLAHVHGVVWAAMQPDWVAVTSMALARERYYCSFNWAYVLFTVGMIGEASVQSAQIWTLEMIMSSERIGLIVLACRQVIFLSLAYFDEAQKTQTHKDLLTYFRRHNISLQTQIQVMFSLTDVAQAQKQQQYHSHLDDLPHQLARALRTELWSDRLSSMGLLQEIGVWHPDFLSELSQLALEKVLPSRCMLLQEGCAAVASYYILDGELTATIRDSSVFIPNFQKGMWVGENSFVGLSLRYSATFSTKCISSLMVIRGNDFQQLVSRLGLMDRFQVFCSEELWKGLCGRCGSLGDHFSDKCPATYGLQMYVPPSDAEGSEPLSPFNGTLPYRRRSNSVTSVHSVNSVGSRMSRHSKQSWMSLTFGGSEKEHHATTNLMGRGLRRLLQEIGLEHLVPIFISMRVHDLDDLTHFDMETFQASLPPGETLSPEQEVGLSPEYVREFRQRSARSVHNVLFRAVNRLHHLMFLSHYKIEAGTEAALMRTELENAIAEDAGSPGHYFDDPVFLDSDNLKNLSDLQLRVKNSHNLVLLLTGGVLSRPWCLVEIVTAKREGVRILPVIVSKPGGSFNFPDEAFYERLKNGEYLDEQALEVLSECDCNINDVEDGIRSVFQHIALPYSPHKGKHIRKAEIAALLKQCRLKEELEHSQAVTTFASSRQPEYFSSGNVAKNFAAERSTASRLADFVIQTSQ